MTIPPVLVAVAAGAAVLLFSDEAEPSQSQPAPNGGPVPKPIDPIDLPSNIDGGFAFAASLPESANGEREARILGAIAAGFYVEPTWIPIESSRGGRTCTFFAASDALGVGVLGDSIRVNLSHVSSQKVADALGCVLPTSRMSDLAWSNATIVLRPQFGIADSYMATTERMVKHSLKVDSAIKAAGGTAAMFVRTVGKDWVSSERLLGRPEKSANFGWHDPGKAPYKSPGGLAVWQPVGLVHEATYKDYSQVVTLYREDCEIDGSIRSVAEVLADPDTAWLLSDEVSQGQACKVARHPAVE